MTEEQEAKLTELYKEELTKQRNFGIKIGVLSASRVILAILDDSARPLTKRIADIRKYCNTSENIAKELGITNDGR